MALGELWLLEEDRLKELERKGGWCFEISEGIE